MLTIILFLGGTAIVGSLGYLAVRPLIMEYWYRWQMDQEQARTTQRRQALREEATLNVLKQLAQQEEARQKTSRKAA